MTHKCLFSALALLSGLIAYPQSLLVDFGASAASNIYNTAAFPGWDNVSISPTTQYVTGGGISGTCLTSFQSDPYSNFTCISGTARNFVRGERVFLSWYNNSANSVEFNPLMSFTDNNNPLNSPGEPLWFIVGKYDNYWIEPGQLLVTHYDITDASDAGEIFPMSQGIYSMLNVCVNTGEPGLILDKIEIGTADTIPPSIPQNLQLTQTTSVSISLSWDPVTDNAGGDGFSHYEIFVNDNLFGLSETEQFTAHLLEAGTNYSFRVRSVDNNRNCSQRSATLSAGTAPAAYGWNLFDPREHFTYKGAFRLPEGGVGTDFNYMNGDPAYYPDGDPANTDDYPGSLFLAGDATHRFVAEISIPEPVISPTKNLEELNLATFLQDFADVASPNITYEEWGWKKGPAIEYLPAQTGQSQGYLYTCHGEYYAWSGDRFNSYGACNTDLSNPSPVGGWFIGPSSNGMLEPQYMTIISFNFALPQAIDGHLLVAGGSRPGYLHNGPTLVAYSPWNDGTPLPQNNTELGFTPLLMYDDDGGENFLNGYGYCDYWYGGAWIELGSRESLVVSGAKGRGREWYGYNNGESTFNVMMNIPTPEEPEDHGPRQSFAQAMLLFYNPQDFIQVANGSREPWEPQPYAVLDPGEYFYYPNDHTPEYIFGFKGAGGMAFDRENSLIYVLERGVTGADNTVAIVHVWQINQSANTKTSEMNEKIEMFYAQGQLNIRSETLIEEAAIQVYDLQGKRIAAFRMEKSNHASFRLAATKGLYIVSLQTPNIVRNRKILISP